MDSLALTTVPFEVVTAQMEYNEIAPETDQLPTLSSLFGDDGSGGAEVDGAVVNDTVSILTIKPHWGDMILNSNKTYEIRRGKCEKHLGKRIGIAFSGTKRIFGFVDFVENVGPFTASTWAAARPQHLVPGDQLPYGNNTCGWRFENPERLATPIPFEFKQGAVIWQTIERSKLAIPTGPAPGP